MNQRRAEDPQSRSTAVPRPSLPKTPSPTLPLPRSPLDPPTGLDEGFELCSCATDIPLFSFFLRLFSIFSCGPSAPCSRMMQRAFSLARSTARGAAPAARGFQSSAVKSLKLQPEANVEVGAAAPRPLRRRRGQHEAQALCGAGRSAVGNRTGRHAPRARCGAPGHCGAPL